MLFRIVSASVLTLALSASLASGECAWVLWETKEDFNAVQNVLDTSWTILRTYETLKGCRDDQGKLLAGDTGWMPYPERVRTPEGDGFYVSLRNGDRLVRTIKQRALCVPGTLDPRGPKAN